VSKIGISPEKKAMIIAAVTSFVLIVLKVTVGIFSGSVAVLASAIDSVLDLLMSGFNVFAVHQSEKPADHVFNYGRGKIEALAAVIEGTVITMSGLFILYASIKKYISGEDVQYLDTSIFVMLISLMITISLVTYLKHVSKTTNSIVLRAESLHYQTDIYTNGVILLALVLIYFTEWKSVDAVMGAGISLYIIYSAYGIIKEGVLMLLDASLDEDIIENIKGIIESENKVEGYHFLRTRRSGKINIVDVHLVFTTEISLLVAHMAGDNIEEKIRDLAEDEEWLLNLHLDPYDDSQGEHF